MKFAGCVLVLFISAVNCLLSEFSKDFLRDKRIFIGTCWGKAEEVAFARALMGRSTRVGAHRGRAGLAMLRRLNGVYLVLDLRKCESSRVALAELAEEDMFVYPIKILLLTSREDLGGLSKKLATYAVLPSSEVVVGVVDERSVLLRQPYKVGKINGIIWENYGNWSFEGGLRQHYKNAPAPSRRSDLKRVNLAVGVIIIDNHTWDHLTDFRDPHIDTFTKQDFGFLECVFEALNINYTIVQQTRYGYYNNQTGKYDGLVADLYEQRIDISGPLYFTLERFKVIDFIKSGNRFEQRFIVRKPSTSYIKNIFFVTFTWQVWLALLLTMSIFAFVVKIILNWETKHEKRQKQLKYTISDVTLITLEAVCQQGTTTEPESLAGRTLTVIFFGALMFLYVAYSANIVVLLQSTTKINNLKELVENRVEVAGVKNSYIKSYFEAPKSGVLRELYLKKIHPTTLYDAATGMEKVRRGNFAFHTNMQEAYQYVLKNFSNHEICGLQELPGYTEYDTSYLGLPKRSPYKELLKVSLLKIDEHGIRGRINSRIIMKPKCHSQLTTFTPVGIFDCHQVFWIWVIGVALALFIFSAEQLRRLPRNH